ncbi:MAG TPA: helix-turn-helix transcriptional regulator [Firmicutes bacterium]|nr:helix-turn-helix transcriptional regulator [Bacillota bacterium]
MLIRENYTCPLELIHDMMKGKWKCIIIWRLRLGATTPSQLRRDINGITEKMLMQHLKELQTYGLVDKISQDTYPLRTEYFLTENGKEVLRALEIYQKLGIKFMLQNGQKEILLKKGLLDE